MPNGLRQYNKDTLDFSYPNSTLTKWFRFSGIINNKDIKKLKCVYKILSPSGRSYIGKTVDLYERFKCYVSAYNAKRNDQPKLMKSFVKYGIQNHKIEILEV